MDEPVDTATGTTPSDAANEAPDAFGREEEPPLAERPHREVVIPLPPQGELGTAHTDLTFAPVI